MAAATGLFVVNAACGQPYPAKTNRIVTTVAGGGSDFTAGLIAPGIAHLAGELARVMARIDIVRIPYQGSGPATQHRTEAGVAD